MYDLIWYMLIFFLYMPNPVLRQYFYVKCKGCGLEYVTILSTYSHCHEIYKVKHNCMDIIGYVYGTLLRKLKVFAISTLLLCMSYNFWSINSSKKIIVYWIFKISEERIFYVYTLRLSLFDVPFGSHILYFKIRAWLSTKLWNSRTFYKVYSGNTVIVCICCVKKSIYLQ